MTTKILAAAIAATMLASCGSQQGSGNSSLSDSTSTEAAAVVETGDSNLDNLSGQELLDALHETVLQKVNMNYDEFLTLNEFDFDEDLDMYHSHMWIREDGYASWEYFYWTMPIDNGGHLVIYHYTEDADNTVNDFHTFVLNSGKLQEVSNILPDKESLASAIGIEPDAISKVVFMTEACGELEAAVFANEIIYNQNFRWNGSQFAEVAKLSSLQGE